MGKLHPLSHLEHLFYVTSGKTQFWGSDFPLGVLRVSSQDSSSSWTFIQPSTDGSSPW